MNRLDLTAALLVWFLVAVPAAGLAQEKPEVLATSADGVFQVERGDAGDVWVVSNKDPGARAVLPKESPDSPADDEFYFSPGEGWLFGLRHVGSGLRYGNVYHCLTPLKIEMPCGAKSFNGLAWEAGRKLGVFKEDYYGEGVYAMTFFIGWSLDSTRLLIRLSGGEEKNAMHDGYLYFNTGTKKFETTDYSRRLSKAKSEVLASAEPAGPLPGEADLKARFDQCDQRLNQTYARVIAQTTKDKVPQLREDQRAWIKHRDEGAQLYVSLFPPAEKERRRLLFLGDVTAARIEELAE